MTTDHLSGNARRAWTLTTSSLDRLLSTLDPDRERAALLYEQLRSRVAGLLRWWGAVHADDLADSTLDRVARRLDEGAEIQAGSLGAYVRGVARLVFYESRRQQIDHQSLDETMPIAAPVADAERQQTMNCLDRCLRSLRKADRDCILRYYDAAGERNMDRRRKLASQLGLSATALRIRTHRIRVDLERCVAQCTSQS